MRYIVCIVADCVEEVLPPDDPRLYETVPGAHSGNADQGLLSDHPPRSVSVQQHLGHRPSAAGPGPGPRPPGRTGELLRQPLPALA